MSYKERERYIDRNDNATIDQNAFHAQKQYEVPLAKKKMMEGVVQNAHVQPMNEKLVCSHSL
jgi:hypothetical protein